ncbi:MAG: WG repeat-containing protein, partial [Bacteroidota bacterium]
PVFDDATLFVEQRCPVLLKRKWGFIDKTGRLVIPAEFDAVGTFNNGLAEVSIGQVEVYVNHSGIIIPQLR